MKMSLKKSFLFGFFGAIGCFASAIGGEGLLASFPIHNTKVSSHDVILLIDRSGSMDGAKLQEVKTAAINFVRRRIALHAKDRIGLVSFESNASLESALTGNLSSLEYVINQLNSGAGTAMDKGLEVAMNQFSQSNISTMRSILLFSDGYPNDAQLALNMASIARNQNIRLITVATNDADKSLLEQITGDPSVVFMTNFGNLDQAFQQAEQAIYGGDLVSQRHAEKNTSVPRYAPLKYTLPRVSGWTAFLALGIAIALIVGQNSYLRRRLLTIREAIQVGLGSIIAGLLTGAITQIFFSLIATSSLGEILGRLIGWTLLGALVGLGMSFFIPNLPSVRAVSGGTIGGLLGVLGFLAVNGFIGNVPGRLLGATIIGFCLGLMIALIEETVRNAAYLIVHYNPNPKEAVKILLGSTPILIGSSQAAHIHSRMLPDVAAKMYVEAGSIVIDIPQTRQKTVLQDGKHVTIGGITIDVHAR